MPSNRCALDRRLLRRLWVSYAGLAVSALATIFSCYIEDTTVSNVFFFIAMQLTGVFAVTFVLAIFDIAWVQDHT